jgi:hypothetical protein
MHTHAHTHKRTRLHACTYTHTHTAGAPAAGQEDGGVGSSDREGLLAQLMQSPSQLHALRLLLGVQVGERKEG